MLHRTTAPLLRRSASAISATTLAAASTTLSNLFDSDDAPPTMMRFDPRLSDSFRILQQQKLLQQQQQRAAPSSSLHQQQEKQPEHEHERAAEDAASLLAHCRAQSKRLANARARRTRQAQLRMQQKLEQRQQAAHRQHPQHQLRTTTTTRIFRNINNNNTATARNKKPPPTMTLAAQTKAAAKLITQLRRERQRLATERFESRILLKKMHARAKRIERRAARHAARLECLHRELSETPELKRLLRMSGPLERKVKRVVDCALGPSCDFVHDVAECLAERERLFALTAVGDVAEDGVDASSSPSAAVSAAAVTACSGGDLIEASNGDDDIEPISEHAMVLSMPDSDEVDFEPLPASEYVVS